MKKGDRGQVTAFIIFALIIVGIIAGYYIFKSENLKLISSEKRINPEIQPIYNYVENCIKETGEDAIEIIGLAGGYYQIPELSIDLGIPYYMHEKIDYTPSKEKIEEQISFYINDNLNDCINNFENFPDFLVNSDNVITKTIIEDEKVVLDLDYRLSVKKGENSYLIEKFNSEIPVRFGVVYDVARNIVANEIKDGKYICIDCVDYFSEKYDLKVNLFSYNENDVIFTIIDENSEINSKDFVFNFVNKYEQIEVGI